MGRWRGFGSSRVRAKWEGKQGRRISAPEADAESDGWGLGWVRVDKPRREGRPRVSSGPRRWRARPGYGRLGAQTIGLEELAGSEGVGDDGDDAAAAAARTCEDVEAKGSLQEVRPRDVGVSGKRGAVQGEDVVREGGVAWSEDRGEVRGEPREG